MQIYKDLKDVNINKPVLTVGAFDGLHVGHSYVINKLKSLASEVNGHSVVLSFWPHPRTIINPQHKTELLNSLEEKIYILEKLGVENFVILNFTKELAEFSYLEFINKVIVKSIGTKYLVMGYDHRFGKNGLGTYEKVRELSVNFGFKLFKLDEVRAGHVVSSTRIRKCLHKGLVRDANKMLGYEYQLWGNVVKGESLGRKLGFPTANIEINNSNKVIPVNGVYAVKVSLKSGNSYIGMMNIGNRPTISSSNKTSIEVNLFDFNGDLYNQELKVSIVDKIRDEKKFLSIHELIDQIKLDKISALSMLS